MSASVCISFIAYSTTSALLHFKPISVLKNQDLCKYIKNCVTFVKSKTQIQKLVFPEWFFTLPVEDNDFQRLLPGISTLVFQYILWKYWHFLSYPRNGIPCCYIPTLGNFHHLSQRGDTKIISEKAQFYNSNLLYFQICSIGKMDVATWKFTYVGVQQNCLKKDWLIDWFLELCSFSYSGVNWKLNNLW